MTFRLATCLALFALGTAGWALADGASTPALRESRCLLRANRRPAGSARRARPQGEPLAGKYLPHTVRIQGWRILYTTSVDDETPATAVARPIAAPLLVAQGLGDELVLPTLTEAFVTSRCAAGQRLDFWTSPAWTTPASWIRNFPLLSRLLALDRRPVCGRTAGLRLPPRGALKRPTLRRTGDGRGSLRPAPFSLTFGFARTARIRLVYAPCIKCAFQKSSLTLTSARKSCPSHPPIWCACPTRAPGFASDLLADAGTQAVLAPRAAISRKSRPLADVQRPLGEAK